MNVSLIVPDSDRILSHRVRGSGIYAENLIKSLRKYDPQNAYVETTLKKVSQKTDLIHFLYFEPFFLTLPIFKKFKTVVTVHDLIPLVFPQNFPRGLKGTIKWEAQKRLLRGCDAVITDSGSSKKDIIKYVGVRDEKIRVVYLAPGEDFKKINDLDKLKRIKIKYRLPDKFALYVGDVTWNKNLPRLVKASQVANVPLVMVGKVLIAKDFNKTNPWNKDLMEVQKLIKTRKDIITTGFLSDEDLVCVYNLATVFVMPSLYEGFGLPILEAMVCGCPVITTKEGSIPEIVKNNVFYVDAYKIENIANGIRKVFDNVKIQMELSKKGMERGKDFSWKKTAQEYSLIYKGYEKNTGIK